MALWNLGLMNRNANILILLWTGDYGLDPVQHIKLDWRRAKKLSWILEATGRRRETPVKLHIESFLQLQSLKQNNQPLDEFLTEAKLLIKNSGYPVDMNDESLHDALVFGVDSDTVRKKCIAEGNKVTNPSDS